MEFTLKLSKEEIAEAVLEYVEKRNPVNLKKSEMEVEFKLRKAYNSNIKEENDSYYLSGATINQIKIRKKDRRHRWLI